MKTIIVLGADRVGKTTLVQKSSDILAGVGRKTQILHFSGVKPCHNSPVDQFLEPFSIGSFKDVDYLFCDRFSPDTLFYESYRYQSGSHPIEYSQVVESTYMERSEDIQVILLDPPWGEIMRNRHEEELRESYPRGTEWWINKMVSNREKEHNAYYDFMYDYLHNKSLFKSSQLTYWSREARSVFDLLPNYAPDV